MSEELITFTDTETSGLFPRHSCIIQIACIKVEHSKRDPLEMRVLFEWERKLEKPDEYEVPEEVARINGYDPEVWVREAQNRRLVMIEYCKILEWSSFGGQNAQYDYRHIEEELHRLDINWPKLKNYSLYSVEMLARPMYLMGILENVKQETLSEFFGLGKQTHDAFDDIRQAVQLYRKLLFVSFHGINDKTLQDARDLELLDMRPTESAPVDQ